MDYLQEAYHPDFEAGRVTPTAERVRALLGEAEKIDVFHREAGVPLTGREKQAEGLNTTEAFNKALRFGGDRYIAVRNESGELEGLQIYENNREGLRGFLLPTRGDELIFEYRE
ncbi:MAG: hypothetical protein ACLFTA_00725 [Candidatus Nanohaloarchaea archaeon]